ncbi:MAG: C39 family peptidase [Leptospirales bacterium]
MKKSRRALLSFVFILLTTQLFAESAFFDIPLSRQSKAYACGQNSFRMVMGYWGERLPMLEIFSETGYNPTSGKTFQKIIKEKYKKYEIKFIKKKLTNLKAELDKKRPVMTGVDAKFLTYLNYDVSAGHFIVIIGYNDNKEEVYIRDPNSDYVEALSYKKLKRAWSGVGYRAFVIYPKNNPKPAGKIQHFASSAKEKGANKVPQKVAFINFLIPSVDIVFDGRMRSENSNKLQEVFPGQPILYTLRLHGLYYGHLTLEKDAWLGNDKTFRGFAASFGFVLGPNKITFSNGENISPGLYYFGRARTLDTLAFTTIKRIPYVNSPVPAMEVSVYQGQSFQEFYNPETNNIKIREVLGGRVGLRYGLGQILGYTSAGVSYAKTNIKIKGVNTEVNPVAYDITAGPLFFGFQNLNHTYQGNRFKKYSYQHGLNLNLNALDIPVIRYLGILGIYYQKSYERSMVKSGGSKETVFNTKNKFELPVNLKIFNLVYGFSTEERVYKSSTGSDRTSRLNMAGLRILLNQWLPKVQLQAGYQYGWETFSHSNSNRAHHNINLGVHFSWM